MSFTEAIKDAIEIMKRQGDIETFTYLVSPSDKIQLDEYYDSHPEIERPNYQSLNIIE